MTLTEGINARGCVCMRMCVSVYISPFPAKISKVLIKLSLIVLENMRMKSCSLAYESLSDAMLACVCWMAYANASIITITITRTDTLQENGGIKEMMWIQFISIALWYCYLNTTRHFEKLLNILNTHKSYNNIFWLISNIILLHTNFNTI